MCMYTFSMEPSWVAGLLAVDADLPLHSVGRMSDHYRQSIQSSHDCGELEQSHSVSPGSVDYVFPMLMGSHLA